MTDKPLRVLIVDDEPPARKILFNYLNAEKNITIVGEAEDGHQALDMLNKQNIDLVFLDIQMPRLTGFEMLAELPENKHPHIIFVTAYDQYALKAFEYHALDYLLKPFTKQRFNDALSHARELIPSKSTSSKADLKQFLETMQYTKKLSDTEQFTKYLHSVVITTSQPYITIETDNIDYIEAADHYVHIFTNGKRYLHNIALKELEDQLDPKQFLRIHRRYIVNLHKIQSVRNGSYGTLTLTLPDKTKLKVSRQKRDILRVLLID